MKVGAGWIKSSKDGKTYISLRVSVPGMNENFALFKNNNKKGSNDPDYILMWSEAKDKPVKPKVDDEIPF